MRKEYVKRFGIRSKKTLKCCPYCLSTAKSRLVKPKLCIVNKDDIDSNILLYSLNKKKRWTLIEEEKFSKKSPRHIKKKEFDDHNLYIHVKSTIDIEGSCGTVEWRELYRKGMTCEKEFDVHVLLPAKKDVNFNHLHICPKSKKYYERKGKLKRGLTDVDFCIH